MFLNTCLRLAVVASVLYCSIYDQTTHLWIPLVTMAIFLIRGIVMAEGDAGRIDALANQIYFIAFSATLSALLGLLARLYLNGEAADDLRPAEMMGAIALVTTLFGIVCMTSLKDYAQKLADEGSPQKPAVSPAAGVSAAPAAAAAGANAENSLDKVAEVNRKAVELIGRFVEHLEKLPVAADRVGAALQRAHGCGEEFVNDVQRMNSVLDEFERLQMRVLDVGSPV
jgi:hypothetical protein